MKHKPVYDPAFKVWFVTRFGDDGGCWVWVAHAPTQELAQRWSDELNARAEGGAA